MSEPSVMCVMLTRDRPEMAARAVRCFRAQTYERKLLFVMDTGDPSSSFGLGIPVNERDQIHCDHYPHIAGWTIGRLRNACGVAAQNLHADIIAHWDDDDWSHPNRIAEQVSLLQASGRLCVGYREMLFSRDGEAWLYRNPNTQYALGTSMCYWRSAWEARPFADISDGEDRQWQMIDGGVLSVSSVPECFFGDEPRMIATIHGGNTHKGYAEELRIMPEWKRVPEWDDYCRTELAK